MPAIPRQKACISCAESKRRCDKQLPECQRCLERDVDCAYPQPKRRRRDTLARASRPEELPVLRNYTDADALGSSMDLGDWDAMGATDLDVSLSDIMIPYMPALPATTSNLSAQEVVLESGNISSIVCPWFLEDETWAMHHCDPDAACVASNDLESFIPEVDEMLKCWVKNGHNVFIHRRLYEKGMPTCLQDAFTTLSAYNNRTPAMRETILQIAEERSCALVRQSPPTAGGARGILAHLARVQALFVYEFIGLFDGSVRLRASAERQLPTLRQWMTQMWEAVKRYKGEDDYIGHRPLQWTASEFDRDYDASSDMWRLWILTESVRRSHIVIGTVANVYECVTKGWADCAGAVMFTARHGLWEADSTVKWYELSRANPPLLAPALQPGPMISQYAAEEFDDFAKTLWTSVAGKDKIQCWIDRSDKANKTWLS